MNGLDPFRRRLDELDDQIARLFGERFAICREIALYKRAHGIPMMQPGRVAEVRERYLARGAEVDLPSDFTANLFELLIGATCKMEDELIGTPPSVVASSSGAPSRVDALSSVEVLSTVDASSSVDTSSTTSAPSSTDMPSKEPEGQKA